MEPLWLGRSNEGDSTETMLSRRYRQEGTMIFRQMLERRFMPRALPNRPAAVKPVGQVCRESP